MRFYGAENVFREQVNYRLKTKIKNTIISNANEQHKCIENRSVFFFLCFKWSTNGKLREIVDEKKFISVDTVT